MSARTAAASDAPRREARVKGVPGLDEEVSPAARLIATSDVETCVDVLEALLSDDRGRTAWLMGFLVGSALREDSAPA
jgi:hypothetical protein